uniref:Proteasome subunit beta n=1 Tax=Noctiluca scintillans TaxID=2966 RepID=A0A7S0ZZK1_NOCSC|mmetsp:Transcript_2577/g.7690  ORF Transcript_2577/g.7690 Transcript_2577/m.7690 type:complete len:240 (+) Transcript_2577:63-782(+)|eukprot:CAMPEP_0194501898 /NCGR_PEP_ID=MMETSP0253-20130528/23506_1 /TAXON_ID=2966 /ORGANISM="Noctiluca scintillans" /LENGTH=239 /DNA_ID=CAMNT_0039343953 /DNA_START=60 /DNA_END=779 /DNA_ORIENTATION=+
MTLFQDSENPIKHTTRPIVTGSTVIGVKFNGGVLVAADTLCSYGSTARFKNVCRLKTVGDNSILAAGGEFSDFQKLSNMIEELYEEGECYDDGAKMGPKEWASYITRVEYQNRSKMNPLWCSLILAGKQAGKTNLSYIDLHGTFFETDSFVATGLGAYMAIPLLRARWSENMSLAEAKEVVSESLKICFYRDCRASNRIQFGVCSDDGVCIEDPVELEHYWGHEAWTKPKLQSSTAATW